jgi:hypothetical protein
MLGGDEKLTSIVNKLLLAGYYLMKPWLCCVDAQQLEAD